MRTQQISYRKVFMKKVLVISRPLGAAAAKLLLENRIGSRIDEQRREPEAISREFPEAAGDLKDLAEYGGSRFETVFGEQFPAGRCGEFDLIVVSPGVPPTIPVLREAEKLGVDAVTIFEVACRLSPAAFVAITGTNGKTTTTTLTGEIFDASGRTTRVVGNIGLPVSFRADAHRTPRCRKSTWGTASDAEKPCPRGCAAAVTSIEGSGDFKITHADGQLRLAAPDTDPAYGSNSAEASICRSRTVR